ncbi:MAG: phosphonate ABC transporter ATP-binding protein [Akkermansiaceae bacterium]
MSLKLTHISHSYGSTQALSNISLDIGTGEQVAIIGPSGCGKTTLLKIMGTQFAPSDGIVSLLSETPDKLSTRELRRLRTKIAMIPQHLGLVANVRVLRNVLNGGLGKLSLLSSLRQMTFPHKKEMSDVYEILERTGIAEKIYDRTDSLSGGQQQRVAVARALYQQPAIILADEPVSAIDPTRARRMIELLTQLSKEEGITLIVSLHNLELAKEFFPRLIGLRAGEMAFDSAPADLTQAQCNSLYQIDSADHG